MSPEVEDHSVLPAMTDYLYSGKDLHPDVTKGLGLFKDGHYDEAIRKASQRFVNRVKELANRPDLDGSGLIEHTFSANKPLLVFNDRKTLVERDEHDGYRFLAVGLTKALRNVLTHHDDYGLTEIEAWEWLIFINAMHRRLDQAEQATTDSD